MTEAFFVENDSDYFLEKMSELGTNLTEITATH